MYYLLEAFSDVGSPGFLHNSNMFLLHFLWNFVPHFDSFDWLRVNQFFTNIFQRKNPHIYKLFNPTIPLLWFPTLYGNAHAVQCIVSPQPPAKLVCVKFANEIIATYGSWDWSCRPAYQWEEDSSRSQAKLQIVKALSQYKNAFLPV